MSIRHLASQASRLTWSVNTPPALPLYPPTLTPLVPIHPPRLCYLPVWGDVRLLLPLCARRPKGCNLRKCRFLSRTEKSLRTHFLHFLSFSPFGKNHPRPSRAHGAQHQWHRTTVSFTLMVRKCWNLKFATILMWLSSCVLFRNVLMVEPL